jgi:hypothetical protein
VSEIDKHLLNQIESSNDFFWLRSRHSLIKNYINKNSIKIVVDVGAGIGGLGDALSVNKDISYYFKEIDRESVEVLEKKFSSEHNLLKNNVDFKESKCLTFLDVIEHVEFPDKFIKQHLENFDSSYIFITVPAYQALWSNWDILLGHYKRYTRKNLINLTESIGLKTIEATYLFPELLVPAIFRKIINSNNINFPKIPIFINKIFYLLSTSIMKLRKILPFGLSVFYFGYYDNKP